VDLSLSALAKVSVHGFASFGRITPPLSLTLSQNDKRRARIPTDAALFAWAFPLAGARGTELVPCR